MEYEMDNIEGFGNITFNDEIKEIYKRDQRTYIIVENVHEDNYVEFSVVVVEFDNQSKPQRVILGTTFRLPISAFTSCFSDKDYINKKLDIERDNSQERIKPIWPNALTLQRLAVEINAFNTQILTLAISHSLMYEFGKLLAEEQ